MFKISSKHFSCLYLQEFFLGLLWTFHQRFLHRNSPSVLNRNLFFFWNYVRGYSCNSLRNSSDIFQESESMQNQCRNNSRYNDTISGLLFRNISKISSWNLYWYLLSFLYKYLQIFFQDSWRNSVWNFSKGSFRYTFT